MVQDVKKVTNWLNTHLDKTVIVQKIEQEDIDQVHIKLSQIDIRQTEEGSDDYEDNAIILKGTGSTMNRDGNLEPLPQDTYELVTEDLSITDFGDEEIELNTARAKYTVSLK
ncbi:hypothetical protein [Paenibacillus crassostreae]|uniref:Uncharacterized protein n=1 Tax=Paenibacillus crassostreae TaxID=1763538 RepID=A0A167FGE9_9BACL|nr:hypothetical protein [Paenibacillus crassostreae]AOZ94428.1 hypothetical protein LPB68_20955 [Paenibacillus crassostreae]OAB76535.1 hypothetical protein PNBC_03785 [Paenibacillus crassostreae]